MAPGPVIRLSDIPPPLSMEQAGQKGREGHAGVLMQNDFATLKEARAEFEREFITRKLRENNGNVSKTADAINVERSNLHRKIKALGIETED